MTSKTVIKKILGVKKIKIEVTSQTKFRFQSTKVHFSLVIDELKLYLSFMRLLW